jgi:hypothetical protein
LQAAGILFFSENDSRHGDGQQNREHKHTVSLIAPVQAETQAARDAGGC